MSWRAGIRLPSTRMIWCLGVHPGAEPADGLPVHLDPARADQLLAVPAAAHARRREHLLQPDAAGDVGEVVPLARVGGEVIVVLKPMLRSARSRALASGDS